MNGEKAGKDLHISTCKSNTQTVKMDSDSESDGSHISTTPPREQHPLINPLLSTVRSKTIKTTKSALNTSRTFIRPKISKKKSIPIPNSQIQPTLPLPEQHSTSPINNIIKPTLEVTPNYAITEHAAGALLPANHFLSKFSFSKHKGNLLHFETDDNISSLIKISDNTSVNSGRKTLNLVGVSEPVAKKVKCSGTEGNFVKLNINGYGRKKFAFKNKKRGSSSSTYSRRGWKYPKKVSSSAGDVDEENGDGLLYGVDVNANVAGLNSKLIQEAVLRVRSNASDENLLELLKLTHGYDSFRDGQLEAIKMVIDGKSTMLVLPTGAGKTLCYQLPALVLKGVTIVVSPLVALMIDQLKQLPSAIRGGLLCSSQTADETSETLKALQEGQIKVLFVSPERFLNAEFLSIFSGSSALSLVVVDEAHCVSEWSHNFRPSYMRLRASLLCGRLNAGCILAMTATATTKTLCDVMHSLDIPRANLIQSAKLRDNLHLSVSMSGNRMKDLLALLRSSPFLEIKSIIIYCKFQYETDMVSKFLHDGNISAKSYHSGLPAKDRIRVQESFCSNKIRVVVATVAFGMGLDKSDVGAVIHYSLPESLEEYVQEIGRAGRDGRMSYCHLLFDDDTYFKLRSLMYSDGVDEYNINKLLCQIFTCKDSAEEIHSIVKESASRKFDMKEEVILTILTQLELGETQYVHLLPQMNVTCTVNFHETSPALLAAKDVVVASILKKSEMKDGQYVFKLPSVANSLRMQALDLSNHLFSLKLKREITYEMKDQAFTYKIVNIPSDLFSLAAQLSKWLGEIETCKVRKLDAVFNATSFAIKECDNAHGCHKNEHTPCLQRKIMTYFNEEIDADEPIQMNQNSSFLRADIKVFLQSNSYAKFTPRAVARILHGLTSPAFPSATWSRTHFWGRYTRMDFKVVMDAAKVELIQFVGKDVI